MCFEINSKFPTKLAAKYAGIEDHKAAPGLYHWASVFYFREEGKAYLVEFNRDPWDGCIVATTQAMTSRRARKIARTSAIKYKLEAPLFTSMKMHNQISKLHDLGGYDILCNNCQTTMTTLLQSLGIALPAHVKNVKETLRPEDAKTLAKAFKKSVKK